MTPGATSTTSLFDKFGMQYGGRFVYCALRFRPASSTASAIVFRMSFSSSFLAKMTGSPSNPVLISFSSLMFFLKLQWYHSPHESEPLDCSRDRRMCIVSQRNVGSFCIEIRTPGTHSIVDQPVDLPT